MTDLTLNEFAPKGDTTTTGPTVSSSYEIHLGLWKNISADMQAYFIMRGSVVCQHNDDFTKSKHIYKDQYRFCTTSVFTRVHTLYSEKSNRTWLCYSPTTDNVYCFVCKLLSSGQNDFTNGFHDWKNAKREVLAKYDPFLATRIDKHGNPGWGKTSYCHLLFVRN